MDNWDGMLFATVFIVFIFFLCRELLCWYWKINERVAMLAEIRDLLKKQGTVTPIVAEGGAVLSGSTSSSNLNNQ